MHEYNYTLLKRVITQWKKTFVKSNQKENNPLLFVDNTECRVLIL